MRVSPVGLGPPRLALFVASTSTAALAADKILASVPGLSFPFFVHMMNAFKAEIEKHLAILDQHLAAKTYLVAEQFSLADVCYMPFLEFLLLMEITPPTAVSGWSKRLLSRPSAVTTRPEK